MERRRGEGIERRQWRRECEALSRLFPRGFSPLLASGAFIAGVWEHARRTLTIGEFL